MCFATLLPLGIVQLFKSVGDGYFEARTVDFLFNDTNRFFEWMRLPGDIIFIVGGVLPVLYIAYIGVRHRVKRVVYGEPGDLLFTEIVEPVAVSAGAGTRQRSRRCVGRMRERRDDGGRRLRRVPARLRAGARMAVGPHASACSTLAHRGPPTTTCTTRGSAPGRAPVAA